MLLKTVDNLHFGTFFSNISKCLYTVDCDAFDILANSLVFCRGFLSINDFKVSSSKSYERAGLSSISTANDVSPKLIFATLTGQF